MPGTAGPSVAVNPGNPRNLLGACMVWHGNQVEHEVIATYAAFDGGRAWHSCGAVPLPHHTLFADDVPVAFDPAARAHAPLPSVPSWPAMRSARSAARRRARAPTAPA